MIVWGGHVGPYGVADGAAFDPGTGKWRRIQDPVLAGRRSASVVWTGSEMVVWGGVDDQAAKSFDDGAAYDPTSDTWRPLPEAQLAGRCSHAAAWTGRELLIWGGEKCGDVGHYFADGAAYRPSREP
jgi:N-acetylneuraminic acid mutarotase